MNNLKYSPNETQQLENKEKKENNKKDNLVQHTLFKKRKSQSDQFFKKLLKRHFPVSHILQKYFNKNTLKNR